MALIVKRIELSLALKFTAVGGIVVEIEITEEKKMITTTYQNMKRKEENLKDGEIKEKSITTNLSFLAQV